MSDEVIYPVLLEKTGDRKISYLVYVPDFDGMTQGKGLKDALHMAEDYISLACVNYQDGGVKLPSSTPLEDVSLKEGQIKTLIMVDLIAYRAKLERRTIRTSVTIPSWLNKAARKAGINYSATLTEALQEKLGYTR